MTNDETEAYEASKPKPIMDESGGAGEAEKNVTPHHA